jgi:RNA-directed DNA polymerase
VGSFDNIDHTYLLAAIGHFPAREVVKQWLKAGYVDRGVFHDPSRDSAGSVIGPLLANVALHGLEDALGVTRRATERSVDHGPSCDTRTTLRCFAKPRATPSGHRHPRGLATPEGPHLSATKTRVVHLTDGFDFLGFTIKHHTATQTRTGYKLLITPSATAVRQLREKLRADWLAHKGASVEAVVRT